MHVIVCLDDARGMLFHQRRQSQDKILKDKIQEICAGHVLWMHPYSENLYAGLDGVTIHVADDFLREAGEGEYCLVETEPLKPVAAKIEKLLIFWWNRRYPGDVTLDLDLQDWLLIGSAEFSGYSHEKITAETYIERKK